MAPASPPSRQRRISRLMALLIGAALAAGVLTGCMSSSRQEKMVAAIEQLAGKSDAPSNARLDWLPFTLPVPDNAPYQKVGNARVYLDVAPHTSVVARPTSKGTQAFVYLDGAPTQDP